MLTQPDATHQMPGPMARMRTALDEYAASIGTCAYDKRNYVLNLLAEQLCDGLAGLAETLTDEDGSRVYDQAQGLVDEINTMFSEAEDKAADRAAEAA